MKKQVSESRFWHRWPLFGQKPKLQGQLVRELLFQLVKGLPPGPEDLTKLLAESVEDRTLWWREAVVALQDAKNAQKGGFTPDCAGAAWRLARILALETYWQEVLEAPFSEPKDQLLEVLGLLLIPDVIPLLETAVLDRSPTVGLTATMMLAQRPEAEVTDFFLQLLTRLESGPWTDRAARGLAARRRIEGRNVWHKLIQVTRNDRSFLRARAWEVLASFGPPAESEEDENLDQALEAGLADSNEEVRARAAEAAGLLLRPLAVPCLIHRLQDEDGRVRAEAARALGRLAVLDLVGESAQGTARQALLQCLEDEDYRVSGCAREALRYISKG